MENWSLKKIQSKHFAKITNFTRNSLKKSLYDTFLKIPMAHSRVKNTKNNSQGILFGATISCSRASFYEPCLDLEVLQSGFGLSFCLFGSGDF